MLITPVAAQNRVPSLPPISPTAPASPDAAYAQYLVGLCYFRQIRDVTQDQKESRRAIEAMQASARPDYLAKLSRDYRRLAYDVQTSSWMKTSVPRA